MERSFLYNLHSHKLKPGVVADPEKFEEVFRSKYGKVRIYKLRGVSQKSKKWVEENRECDAGGWFCPGKYPPGLKEILDKKKDFAQLEDFNRNMKQDIVAYLGRSLGNTLIRITPVLPEGGEDGNMLYTAEDKFDHMSKKNPNLARLKQRFNLDFE